MCLVMDPNIGFDDLCDDLRDLCKFNSEDPITMKWIDEEGWSSFYLRSLYVCLGK